MRALVDTASQPADFAHPGHVFPLRAHPGGARARSGHTEAAVELARLSGQIASGVICEVANDDGTMAQPPELLVFADSRHAIGDNQGLGSVCGTTCRDGPRKGRPVVSTHDRRAGARPLR